MIAPWIIHEADIALYPAWKDGLPFLGPGLTRGAVEPVFGCKASLSLTASTTRQATTGHNWSGNETHGEGEWQIAVGFPDGLHADAISRVLSRLHAGGFHILCVRFVDALTGQWSVLRFYYVTWDADEASDSSQIMQRSLRLRATWMQEEVGSAAPPSLSPVPLGEVDWICGSQRITCLTYHPDSETWASLPRNDVGDGTRYVNFAPVLDVPSDVALAAYFPRVIPGEQAAPALPMAGVLWQNLMLLRIGNHSSALHHGLVLLGGIQMQEAGIVEPLLLYPQARMLDEPVVVFRYLRRTYATLGHGVLAVPRLVANAAPPLSHDYPFRLSIPGAANPATGQSGLTLLPDGAWLDGTTTLIE
jgi:hypothetical protein